jgi:hypothetical protein
MRTRKRRPWPARRPRRAVLAEHPHPDEKPLGSDGKKGSPPGQVGRRTTPTQRHLPWERRGPAILALCTLVRWRVTSPGRPHSGFGRGLFVRSEASTSPTAVNRGAATPKNAAHSRKSGLTRTTDGPGASDFPAVPPVGLFAAGCGDCAAVRESLGPSRNARPASLDPANFEAA